MKYCQNCKLEFEDKFSFCQQCGSKLESIQKQPVLNSKEGSQADTKENKVKSVVPEKKGLNKNIIVIGLLACIAVVFVLFGGGLSLEKQLPREESDGTYALAFASSDGKWGIIDKKGDWFIKPKYLSIGHFSEGLAPALDPDTKKWGFIDKNEKWIIKPQFYESQKNIDEIGHLSKWIGFYCNQIVNLETPSFHDGLVRVRLAEKDYAYVNKEGKIICSGFEDADYKFKHGYAKAIVKKGKKGVFDNVEAIIDKKGQYVVKPVEGRISGPTEGYFLVIKFYSKECGFIKPYEDKYCSPVFNEASEFSEGLSVVQVDGAIYFIDENFNIVKKITSLRPYIDYDQIGYINQFHDGILKITLFKNGRHVGDVTVNRQGDLISPEPEIEDYSHIKANELYPEMGKVAMTGKFGMFGYINNKGKFVIQPQFSHASKFKDGLAVVQKNKKYGVIDMKGRYVKDLTYDLLLDNSCGLIVAKWDDKVGALDGKELKVVISNKFDAIYNFINYKKQDLVL